MKKKIACLGSSAGSPGDSMYNAMIEVGKLLTQNEVTVMTGGHGGSGMEAPACGARSLGGDVILIPLSGFDRNPFGTDIIDVVDQGADTIEKEFGMRLGYLLEADGFIIGADGGPGTVLELLALINLSIKVWGGEKRVAILKPEGVSGTLDKILPVFKELGLGIGQTFSEAEDAVTYVLEEH